MSSVRHDVDSKQVSLVLACLLVALLAWPERGLGQSAPDYVVHVSATVQKSPVQITLNWSRNSNAISYTIYRKTVDATLWGDPLASLPGDASSYSDTNVSVGAKYEYQVQRVTRDYRVAYSYITAGIEVPLVEYRGKVILIVDNTYAAQLAVELARLEQDLIGDGWTVIRHDVSRAERVPNIRSIIKADYDSDPSQVKAVFLFGHVPVPYSGNIAPDGHRAHTGAWPADLFYGDMDGVWSDSHNLTTSASGRQSNMRGDGKFDQSSIPSPVELQVGRVDLVDMPAFAPKTELDLLRQYLNKNHNFRHRLTIVERRALVDDNFGYFGGESFASSGWRNFPTFFGTANVETQDWLSALSMQSYLWAYGCGSGDYTSAEGVGSTSDFAAVDPKVVFTMLFGSWFGDWDMQDNFLRAPLATATYGLTSAWAGRPHWYFHHMALGETIGYSTRLTQNAPPALYGNSSGLGSIHVALMGDPTLRMHPVAPASQLSVNAVPSRGGIELRWIASPDDVIGYHVYRSNTSSGPFSRVNSTLVQGTSFNDQGVPTGTVTYMVRAVKLESSASGTYFNASQGVFATLTTYSVSGRVTDANGNSVSNVTVTLSGPQTAATQTDINGNYSFVNLAAGDSYAIKASKTNYSVNPQNQIINNLSRNHSDTNFTATLSLAPLIAPKLLTEGNTEQATALESITHLRGPFSLISPHNFSLDQYTRVILFVINVELMPNEGPSTITAQAEDSQHRVYPLTVEFVGKVQNIDWLTQLIVKLPNEVIDARELRVSINWHGLTSNKALIPIKGIIAPQ